MKRTPKYAVTSSRQYPFYSRWFSPKSSLRAALSAARRHNEGLIAGCEIREQAVDQREVAFVVNIKSGREWHVQHKEG